MAGVTTRMPISSGKSLRALILEDDPQDAELMAAILTRAGYSLSSEVIDSPAQFQQQLAQADYDVILADYNLRTWTAMDALEILVKSGKDIPFLVVTGTLGDEAAVECIKHGAADYVLKHRLARLPVAVSHALEEKAHREEAARAAEQIRRAKREWELTFDAVPDPVVLLDDQCRIMRANCAAAALVGAEPAQLVGKYCYEVLHGVTQPRPDCPHQRLLQTGKEEHGDMPEPRLGKIFAATATPVRDASGVLRGCVRVLRDITERKRVEEALRASEERYRTLFQGAAEGILVADIETKKFRYANPAVCRMLGYTEEELGQMGLSDIHPPRDLEWVVAEFMAQARGEKTVVSAVPCLRKDGTTIYADITTAPVVIDGKDYNVGFFNDVTERKQLQEQLREAQKMEAVGRLAGGIAHDFNNLLTIINGYGQLVLDRLGSRDPLRGQVEEIKKAGERATALTRQLLAFSRRQVLAPQVLDLNEVVANIDKMLRRLIGEDIDLVTVLGANLGRVKADPGQIEQVILNLAVNARDAMPHGGKLTLETANAELDAGYAQGHFAVQPGQYVRLAVSDTGHGMDAETQSHIFEPFFTTKEQGKGTGLGLAMVYGIVKQSGGHIWVYSETGLGTTFKIYLPQVSEAVAVPETRTPLIAPGRGTETILLVEDEVAVRLLARGVLESHGYKVLEARHGEDALLICEQYKGPIHLLLTDVVMPQMNGPELAEHLAPFHREMKVLYMSGYTDNATVHHGVLNSGTAFLQKPFIPEALARKVREVLDTVHK